MGLNQSQESYPKKTHLLGVKMRILTLSYGLILNLVYLFASVWPRDPARWVFGAWNGKKFLDNPKYVFLHTLNSQPDVRVVWITKSRKLAQEMRIRGLPAAYTGSLVGIWAQLRAGVVVFSHSVEWDLCAPLIARKVLRVQNWHGIPIKHIGYDDKKDITIKYARLKAAIFPYKDDRLDLVTAAGQADQACFRTAFNVKEDAVIITGYPRNDPMFRTARDHQGEYYPIKNAIYMPTLRGVAGAEFTLFESTGFDFKKIDMVCERLGIHLWIKLHPVQKFRQKDLVALELCKHLHAYTDNNDIYESMGDYDVLITDFSSIYLDYMVIGRPIILAPLDMADYTVNDRSLYYEYKDLCWEAPCVSWVEVMKRLERLCVRQSAIPEGYLELQRRFHTYLDDQSALRVTQSIKHLSLKPSLRVGNMLS